MILASFWTLSLSFVFILVSLLLIGLILLQKNRGSGLSGAFGGVGGHSAFGTKTGDFLTWLTVGLTGVFMLLAIIGNFAFEPANVARKRAAQQAPPAPVNAPTPLPLSPSPTPAPVPTQAPPVTPVTVTPTPAAPPPAAPAPSSEAPSGSPASATPPVSDGTSPATP